MTGLESGGPGMNIRYRVELNEAERTLSMAAWTRAFLARAA
jgi:hypothetical protein